MTTNAFGTLGFQSPLGLVSPPGETNRLFVVEQNGRIAVITNLAAPSRTVFLDLTGKVRYGGEEGLLGLAFHPGYATNGYFYVFYTLYTNQASGSSTRHDRLARFEVSANNPNVADAASEQVLINQRDEASNHNAGDLHFGPDGYLYVSLGDEGGGNDQFLNSQRIDKDFFAGIIRIDVDKRPGNLTPNAHPANNVGGQFNYSIPADNPFVGATSFNGQPVDPAQVLTEFWAVGLRNPWRMSFDPATGFLYCADVGQNQWEEINIIQRGGNYGWAYREGLHAGPKTGVPAGFTSVEPIQEYGHGSGGNEGFSVTGGVVYRGSRYPDLYGAYVFADYVSGNVWALRYEASQTATNITPFYRLTGSPNIAGFGRDPSNGDVLLCDLTAGLIRRLVRIQTSGGTIPPTLADTGAFSDLGALTPNPGIVPYDINVPFWTDGAVKWRWLSIPNLANRITFRPTNAWTFPSRTIFVKHFELELTNGVPESRRRLETRFMVRDAAGNPGFYGVTYRWGDSRTNAMLVDEAGMDEPFVVNDHGILRTQVWHYPSRSECMICHNSPASGYGLGLSTPQMNRDVKYGEVAENQLLALSRAGYFNTNLTTVNQFAATATATNEAHSLEWRARSYLAANCAYCHSTIGTGRGLFITSIHPPMSALGVIHGPVLDNFGNPANRVVVPGSAENSMLLQRLLSTNPATRMPPIGSSLLDTQGVALLSAWITNELRGYKTLGEWRTNHFGNDVNGAGAVMADADGDGAKNLLEWLVGTNPTNAADPWRITLQRRETNVAVQFDRVANRGFEVQWASNLWATSSWRFLDVPENRRVYARTNGPVAVPDRETEPAGRFYRVRVFEP